MQLRLRIFYDEQCARICSKAGGHYGQCMGKPKADIGRSQDVTIGSSFAAIGKNETDKIGHGYRRRLHPHTGAELLHPRIDLRDQTHRFALVWVAHDVGRDNLLSELKQEMRGELPARAEEKLLTHRILGLWKGHRRSDAIGAKKLEAMRKKVEQRQFT